MRAKPLHVLDDTIEVAKFQNVKPKRKSRSSVIMFAPPSLRASASQPETFRLGKTLQN